MQVSTRFIAFIAASLAGTILCSQQANALSIPLKICAGELTATADVITAPETGLSRLELMRLKQETGLLTSAATELLSAAPRDTAAPCVPDIPVPLFVAPEFAEVPVEPPLPATDTPDVFGSIALPVSHTPLDRKWRLASRSRLAKGSGPWVSILRSVSKQDRASQTKAINEWVNARVRFADDRDDKLTADRWSGASDTLRRQRGDCEDYAIAKMKLLEAAGLDRKDMYLVVVDDLVRRADHALLVVRLGQNLVVLDNSTDQLLDARNAADYRPIFSYSASGTWIHGYAQTVDKVAQI